MGGGGLSSCAGRLLAGRDGSTPDQVDAGKLELRAAAARRITDRTDEPERASEWGRFVTGYRCPASERAEPRDIRDIRDIPEIREAVTISQHGGWDGRQRRRDERCTYVRIVDALSFTRRTQTKDDRRQTKESLEGEPEARDDLPSNRQEEAASTNTIKHQKERRNPPTTGRMSSEDQR